MNPDTLFASLFILASLGSLVWLITLLISD